VDNSPLARTTALAAVALAWLAGPPLCAAEGPANEALKKHGLRIVGTLAVVDEEAQIKTNLAEARRQSKQLNYLLLQQKGTLSPGEVQQTVKNVNNEINQLRSAINTTGQQMNSIPKWRGRFVSNDAQMMYSQLNSYRSQLQMELNQDTYFLNQLKSQSTDPQARAKIDSEVRDVRDSYHQAILDLRKLVDSATGKYDELAKNDEVKQALIASGKGQKTKPKLGPSHEFKSNVKLLERMEKTESGGETESAEPKPAARSRRGSRTKNAAKGADTQPDSGNSP
jgi:hypothetical protein